MVKTLRVDFHCHTLYSPDSLATPAQIAEVCHRKGIDRVVITDHNTIRGAHEAIAYDPLLFIQGEEIKTTDGEILAAYVKEEVPKGIAPLDGIRMLKEQGAFISLSHPYDKMRYGWSSEGLSAMLPLVDAIEVFNARCSSVAINQQAASLAELHHMAGTAGSDAHAAFEVGRGLLELPSFDDAASLRRAIGQGRVVGKLSPFWVHFYSSYARMKKELDRQKKAK